MPALLAYLGGLVRPAPRMLGFVTGERRRARDTRGQDSAAPPAARLSPGLVALATLDELIVAIMKTPGRIPTPDRFDGAVAELVAARDLYARRGWIADPLSYHTAPPPLERPGIARGPRLPGLGYEHMTFDSGYSPDPEDPGAARWLTHEPNHTVHAWVLRHRDGAARPWVVCLHAFGMGYAPVDLRAFKAGWLHRDLGLNVIMPVMPMHGPRRIGRLSGAGFMTYNLVDMVHGFGQAIWDVRRILSWIRAHGGERIAVYGASMGGHIAALLAGVEPDLACVVPAFPTADLVALMREHGPGSIVKRAAGNPLAGEVAEQVQRLASPLALPARVPAERLFIVAGLADRMATPAQAHRLWEHWGRPRIKWLNANHLAFMWSGEVTGFVREALATTRVI